MYIAYFNALKTLIKDELNSLKTVDWYNGQYQRYEDLKAVAFPACYIEFESPINWLDTSNNMQIAETSLYLHLVQRDLGDSPESIMNLAQETHLALHGRSLVHENQRISTSLSRSESELITEYDQLKVMKLRYNTSLMDCASIPQYRKQKVRLKLEL